MAKSMGRFIFLLVGAHLMQQISGAETITTVTITYGSVVVLGETTQNVANTELTIAVAVNTDGPVTGDAADYIEVKFRSDHVVCDTIASSATATAAVTITGTGLTDTNANYSFTPEASAVADAECAIKFLDGAGVGLLDGAGAYAAGAITYTIVIKKGLTFVGCPKATLGGYISTVYHTAGTNGTATVTHNSATGLTIVNDICDGLQTLTGAKSARTRSIASPYMYTTTASTYSNILTATPLVISFQNKAYKWGHVPAETTQLQPFNTINVTIGGTSGCAHSWGVFKVGTDMNNVRTNAGAADITDGRITKICSWDSVSQEATYELVSTHSGAEVAKNSYVSMQIFGTATSGQTFQITDCSKLSVTVTDTRSGFSAGVSSTDLTQVSACATKPAYSGVNVTCGNLTVGNVDGGDGGTGGAGGDGGAGATSSRQLTSGASANSLQIPGILLIFAAIRHLC